MDTNTPKTPATLPFADWQAMPPADAAHEVHARIAALPAPLRAAALAWLKPERDLVAEMERWNGLTSGRFQRAEVGALHPLHGIPYFLKDLYDLAGVPTRAGATFLDKVRPTPTQDSRIVQQLRELGAACAGKSQLVEFASGLTGENPHYGDCPHPQFPDRLTGGSSSGSAALVAAGVVPLAIGSDTGGSIRVPAAFCGLHGFRLTPGEPLIRDAFPLSPTMDTVGWFTANARDMHTAWKALLPGRASRAPATVCHPPDEPSTLAQTAARPEDSPYPSNKFSDLRGCHLPMEALLPQADFATVRACDAAAAQICPPADATSQADLIDSWREAVDAYLTIGMSDAHVVHRDWLAPYREHYDPVIWKRFTDAGSYPAEQIARARAVQKGIWETWRQFFFNYDYLVLPAVPSPAPHKADCTPELRRSIIRLTAPASLGGLPVLSIPVPLPSGLTVGLQIILPVANSPVVPWLLSR